MGRWGCLHRAGGATLLVALAAALAPMGPAAARAPQPGGLSVSPARIERDLPGRAVAVDVNFKNNEAVPLTMTFELTGLGHELDGSATFPPAGELPATLSVNPRSARVAPGAAQRVTLRGTLPAGSPGLYAGVVATLEPKRTAGSGINVRQQLAALVLMRGPKPWNESFRVETVAAGPQKGSQALRLTAVVRNTGNVHVRPTGAVAVVHKGRTLATVDLRPEAVIPGYARRLSGTWTAPGDLDGPVRFEARFAGAPAPATTTVQLDGGRPPGSGAGGPEGQASGGGSRGVAVVAGLAALAVLALIAFGLVAAARRRR